MLFGMFKVHLAIFGSDQHLPFVHVTVTVSDQCQIGVKNMSSLVVCQTRLLPYTKYCVWAYSSLWRSFDPEIWICLYVSLLTHSRSAQFSAPCVCTYVPLAQLWPTCWWRFDHVIEAYTESLALTSPALHVYVKPTQWNKLFSDLFTGFIPSLPVPAGYTAFNSVRYYRFPDQCVVSGYHLLKDIALRITVGASSHILMHSHSIYNCGKLVSKSMNCRHDRTLRLTPAPWGICTLTGVLGVED